MLGALALVYFVTFKIIAFGGGMHILPMVLRGRDYPNCFSLYETSFLCTIFMYKFFRTQSPIDKGGGGGPGS